MKTSPTDRTSNAALPGLGLVCAVTVGVLGSLSLSGKDGAWSQTIRQVPTQRVIVPEEPAGDDESNVIEVPTDELPSFDKSEDGQTPATDGDVEQTNVLRDESGPPPTVHYDFSKLPFAVRQTRQNILDSALTGDVEKLRPLIGVGEHATSLSLGGLDGDPIEFLKETSGDSEGQEILAILIEVLEAGYVHMDKGTDDEMYVWPYFFAWPLEKLTPPMRVELFRILTAGDVEDAKEFGGYVFYRLGIKPNGTWSFFVAGD